MSGSTPAHGQWLRHVVLLRARPELSWQEQSGVEAALAQLVERPPFGSNASIARDLGLRPESDRAATWMVSIDFDGDEQFVDYLTSREHTSFLRDHGPNLETLLAIQVLI